jgi:uncharacterized LabA/DUF88 family protein
MDRRGNLRVGVYVDVSNIALNGGFGMHYDVLREFASRNNGVPLRLNAYVAYDEDMAGKNPEYRNKARSFHSILRDFGYKVIVKKVRWFTDEQGNRYGKSNADLEMAVDALMQSERLDYVLLVTGDGDFIQVIRALQNKGCRVEVLAFKNVAKELRNEADVFTSGFLVPNLLPILVSNEAKEKKFVRGICYSYLADKNFGFLRFLKEISGGMWITDSRKQDSPFDTAFVHASQFPDSVDLYALPSREQIFEFELKKVEEGWQAENVKVVYHY